MRPQLFQIAFTGWADWRLLSHPLAITLQDVALSLEFGVDAGSRGKASGWLTIGEGDNRGALYFWVSLPFENSSAFVLSYETRPGEKAPTLAALVSFMAQGWTLPKDVEKVGRAITFEKFFVAVGRPSGISVAVDATGDQKWPLVPGEDRLTLTQLRLELSVLTDNAEESLQAPNATAVAVWARLCASLKVGSNGFLPLAVGLQGSWDRFSVSLNKDAEPAQLPSVGDLANLVVEGWRDNLPRALADLGASMDLKTFSFTHEPQGWTIDIEISTKGAWSYPPVPDLEALKFTAARLSFCKPDSGNSHGEAELDLCMGKIPVTFTFIVPQSVFTGRLEAGKWHLRDLCEYVGLGSAVPPWLDIALPELILTVEWRQGIYRVTARFNQDIFVPGGSRLRSPGIEATVGGGKRRACITARWDPTGNSDGVQGELCHPFEKFCFEGGKCVRIPPDFKPPPNPDDPPGYENVKELLTIGVLSGLGIFALVALAVAYGAARVEVVQALFELGVAQAQQGEVIRALAEYYERQQPLLQLLRDFKQGYEQAERELFTLREMVKAAREAQYSPMEVAPPLKTMYEPPPAEMCQTLHEAWGKTIEPGLMARALAVAPYDPVPCGAPIRTTYGLESGGTLAALVMDAGFSPRPSPLVLAQTLAGATFDAGQAFDGVATSFWDCSLHVLAHAMAGAGYAAVAVAPVLRRSPVYGPQVPDAGTMLDVLADAWPSLAVAEAASALAAAPYAPVFSALALHASPRFRPGVDTATKMARVLAAAFRSSLDLATLVAALASVPFPAFEAGAAVVAVSATKPTASVLASALAGSYPVLNPAQLGAALAVAPFPAVEIVAGVTGVFPGLPSGLSVVVSQATTSGGFPSHLAAAAQAWKAGRTAPELARFLVESEPLLDGTVLVVLVTAVATPPSPTLPELAAAVFPAYAAPDPARLATGLLLLGAPPSAGQLCAAVVTGLKSAGRPIDAVLVAPALAAALAQIGFTLTAAALAQGLIAGYEAVTEPAPSARTVAAALVAAIPDVTVGQVVNALFGAFTSPMILPPACAKAAALAFAVPPSAPNRLAQPVAETFAVSQCPAGTPVLGLTMQVCAFEQREAAVALHATMRGWTGADGSLLADIYRQPQWPAAWVYAEGGLAAPEIATNLHASYRLAALDMVTVLVGCLNLAEHSRAATPLAEALKAVAVDLPAALEALHAFFGEDWTGDDTRAVRRVYGWPGMRRHVASLVGPDAAGRWMFDPMEAASARATEQGAIATSTVRGRQHLLYASADGGLHLLRYSLPSHTWTRVALGVTDAEPTIGPTAWVAGSREHFAYADVAGSVQEQYRFGADHWRRNVIVPKLAWWRNENLTSWVTADAQHLAFIAMRSLFAYRSEFGTHTWERELSREFYPGPEGLTSWVSPPLPGSVEMQHIVSTVWWGHRDSNSIVEFYGPDNGGWTGSNLCDDVVYGAGHHNRLASWVRETDNTWSQHIVYVARGGKLREIYWSPQDRHWRPRTVAEGVSLKTPIASWGGRHVAFIDSGGLLHRASWDEQASRWDDQTVGHGQPRPATTAGLAGWDETAPAVGPVSRIIYVVGED